MTNVGMHQAKTHLSELVERALGGEEIVLTRRGKPAVRLIPERPAGGLAALNGVWRDRVRIADDFGELPEELAEELGMR